MSLMAIHHIVVEVTMDTSSCSGLMENGFVVYFTWNGLMETGDNTIKLRMGEHMEK